MRDPDGEEVLTSSYQTCYVVHTPQAAPRTGKTSTKRAAEELGKHMLRYSYYLGVGFLPQEVLAQCRECWRQKEGGRASEPSEGNQKRVSNTSSRGCWPVCPQSSTAKQHPHSPAGVRPEQAAHFPGALTSQAAHFLLSPGALGARAGPQEGGSRLTTLVPKPRLFLNSRLYLLAPHSCRLSARPHKRRCSYSPVTDGSGRVQKRRPLPGAAAGEGREGGSPHCQARALTNSRMWVPQVSLNSKTLVQPRSWIPRAVPTAYALADGKECDTGLVLS